VNFDEPLNAKLKECFKLTLTTNNTFTFIHVMSNHTTEKENY